MTTTDQPESMRMTDRMNREMERLPVAAIADKLNATLQTSAAAIVTAAPGAGKSTLLPLTMLLGTTTGERSAADGSSPDGVAGRGKIRYARLVRAGGGRLQEMVSVTRRDNPLRSFR